ncbi:MAG: N-acetylmuramoyl-L-alanine amidase [Betaproteobacteria bacterium]
MQHDSKLCGPLQSLAHWCGVLLAAALVAGCAGPRIDADTHRAVSHDSRAQFLILHYTAVDLATSIRILTQQRVSSHYLVTDEQPPRIYRLVDEDRRAWHAGISAWDGHAMLNGNSIGIEIVNLGNRSGPDGRPTDFQPYPPEQVELVVELVRDIVKRHQIRPDRVLGHSDIAPQRKIDPGPLFPWKRLADEGLVTWPKPEDVLQAQALYATAVPPVQWFQQALAKHGFLVAQHGELDEPTRRVVAAFQMKYRPAKYDGQPDAETAALLTALTGLRHQAKAP